MILYCYIDQYGIFKLRSSVVPAAGVRGAAFFDSPCGGFTHVENRVL